MCSSCNQPTRQTYEHPAGRPFSLSDAEVLNPYFHQCYSAPGNTASEAIGRSYLLSVEGGYRFNHLGLLFGSQLGINGNCDSLLGCTLRLRKVSFSIT